MFDRTELVGACIKGDIDACLMVSQFNGAQAMIVAAIAIGGVLTLQFLVPELIDHLKARWRMSRRKRR